MALLLQIPHDDTRANLGATDRVLYVFQCADLDRQGCSEFDRDGAGNACFILDRAEQIGSVTAAPESEAPPNIGWTLTGFERTPDLNQEDIDLGEEPSPLLVTKLGGAPGWIQYDESPAGAWRFLLQLDTNSLPRGQETSLRDVGIAYIFVRSDGAPEASLIWQCS